MSSTSAAGVSIITLQFALGQTLDVAEQEVQAAINAGGSLLPADLPAPPVYAKVNPADAPVLTLAITLRHAAADRGAEPRQHAAGAEDQPGVAASAWSRSRGGQRPAVRIQADTQALASYGIGLDTLRTAIAAANANSAKGSFDGPTRAYTINANDQLLTADDYQKLIVAYKNGAPVRLIDVARVVESAENTRLGAWAGKDGELRAGDHPQRAAPAGRQRDRHRRRDQGAAARAAGRPAGERCEVDVLTDRTTGIRASVQPRRDRAACWRWCWSCW